MMYKPAYNEAFGITQRMMQKLVNFSIATGIDGANFRSAVGQLLGNFSVLINSGIFGTQLLACFDSARVAGADIGVMDNVRNQIFAETPTFMMAQMIINAGLIFSLSEQVQIITPMVFDSRNEVDALMDKMAVVIDDIKLYGSESFTSNDYRNVVEMSAALIFHLSSTERLLPRVVTYHLRAILPALAVSNRIYGDGSRSDELIAENKTVHPAFMQPDVIALSA